MPSSEEKEEHEMIKKDEEEEPISSEEKEPVPSEEEPVTSEEKEEKEEDEEELPVCRLSLPAHPHYLSRGNKEETHGICFAGSGIDEIDQSDYYYCTTCDVQFDGGCCYYRPRMMRHPYHPQHPLIYTALTSKDIGLVYESHAHDERDERDIEEVVGIPNPGIIFDKCNWCGEDTDNRYMMFYRCSICNFCLCSYCSKTFPLPTIQNPKNHHHSLTFLPRPLLLPCDSCGLVERSEPSYGCFQCNFVVHKSCADLPRVIKLTRHPHRLFYTPSLSPTISLCRLCYKTIDVKYGHYSCKHDDCSFVVHSKCATHKEVWDGTELEWEPEDLVKLKMLRRSRKLVKI